MKPQGRGTDSLLRAVRAAGFREKTIQKKDSLIERARSESQGWMSRKIRGIRPRRDFFLDIPFHRTMLHALGLEKITIRQPHRSGSSPSTNSSSLRVTCQRRDYREETNVVSTSLTRSSVLTRTGSWRSPHSRTSASQVNLVCGATSIQNRLGKFVCRTRRRRHAS